MGKVVVPIEVLPPTGSRRGLSLEALVNTGATLSMVPAATLRRLGIRPVERMPIRMADGRVVRRSVGEARLRVDGHVVTSRVIFGQPHDATVLGLVVLESLGLTVDPSKGQIVKGEVLLLSIGSPADLLRPLKCEAFRGLSPGNRSAISQGKSNAGLNSPSHLRSLTFRK